MGPPHVLSVVAPFNRIRSLGTMQKQPRNLQKEASAPRPPTAGLNYASSTAGTGARAA